ncbi:MAG: DUF6174 domain-containing protein [Gemmatimonas sp.]
MKRILIPSLTALAVLLAACGDDSNPVIDIEGPRAKWTANRPPSYSYTLARGCFCPTELTTPVEIVVRNGAVESRTYQNSTTPVPAAYAGYFPTIDGLFAKLDSARLAKPFILNLSFDETYGYPTLINVDQSRNAVDEEYTYVASNFVVR